VDTQTTGQTGVIAWSTLNDGSYVVVEHDGEPCRITSSHQDGSDHILVIEGETTVVKVYNCGYGHEWSTPTKYPNTGVTGRDGRLTWTDLPPGTYQIDELGRDWCRIESKNLDPGGKGITVNPGEDAVVHVYNCDKRTTPKPIPFPIPPPLIPGPREW